MSISRNASSSSSSSSSSSCRESEVAESAEYRKKRINNELGQKMLSGWTLLSQTCPRCMTILVRSKQAQIFCVGCQLICLTEDQAKEQGIGINSNLFQSDSSSKNRDDKIPNNAISSLIPPSSNATASSPLHYSSQIKTNGLPAPPKSHSSPFGSFRLNRLSNDVPLEEDEEEEEEERKGEKRERPQPPQRDADGLLSLSSSPFFNQMAQQLAEANNNVKISPFSSPFTNPISSTSKRRNDNINSNESKESADFCMSDAEMEAHMSRLNRMSSALGAKMLAGWTLLGVHCSKEDCNCPLMRNPKTREMLCVSCGEIYYEEGSEQAKAINNSQSTNNTKKDTTATSSFHLLSQPEMKIKPDPPSSLRLSAAAANRRRKGQLEEEEDTSESSVDQSESGKEDERVEEYDSRPTQQRISQPYKRINEPSPTSNQHSLSSSASSTEFDHSGDVSERLSAKMLSGYTLLAAECPNPSCSCPLVRKKGGPMLCVQCGSIITEEEKKEQQEAKELDQPKHKQNQDLSDAPNFKTSTASTILSSAISEETDAKHSDHNLHHRHDYHQQQQQQQQQPHKQHSPRQQRLLLHSKSSADTSPHLSTIAASARSNLKTSTTNRITARPLPLKSAQMATNSGRFAPVDATPPTRTPPSTPAPLPLYPTSSSAPATTLLRPLSHSSIGHLSAPTSSPASRASSAILPNNFPPTPMTPALNGAGLFFAENMQNIPHPPVAGTQQLPSVGGNWARLPHPPTVDTSSSVLGDNQSPLSISATTALSPASDVTEQQILKTSIDSLLAKLNECNDILRICDSVSDLATIAVAIKELALALRAIREC